MKLRARCDFGVGWVGSRVWRCTHVFTPYASAFHAIGRYTVATYIDTVPNRSSPPPPAILLREAHRDGTKIIKRTIANLSDWPPEKVDALRRVLRGELLVAPDSLFAIKRSLPHGHVHVVPAAIPRLGVERLLGSVRSRERDLVESGALQISLFDEQNLAEVRSAEYPGERLIVCFNPLLAHHWQRTRKELVQATKERLRTLQREVARRTKTPMTAAEIGVKGGRVINQFKLGKHFEVEIGEGRLAFRRREKAIQKEAAQDGISVIRTSETVERMEAGEVVRVYKSLTHVERAFRCLKGMDLRVRPIFLRQEDYVRAHVLLCMLAYYVEWHLLRALAPLLFHAELLEADRLYRDPVAPAKLSASVKRKRLTRTTADGLPLHSFRTLLTELATLCRNTCSLKSQPASPTFDQLTEATPLQRRAFGLLENVPMFR